MKNILLAVLCLAFGLYIYVDKANDKKVKIQETEALAHSVNDKIQLADDHQPLVQIALLLDVSNSMDGLIDQAKSQIWKMVNELAVTKQNGKAPKIELALFEYGKSTLARNKGFIKEISPLTTDLDLISDKLFSLATNGGDEFCGWVINDAVINLKWSDSNNDLKLIIIAGNEPFSQGSVDYKKACSAAIAKGIMVNTIFCGDYDEGVRTSWANGANLADGKYMNIDQNEEVVHINSPFDKDIIKLNESLNKTYLSFGEKGKERKKMQEKQDENASSYGASNLVNRAVSKSNVVYSNTQWDLVDASADEEFAIEEVEKEALPAIMQEMDIKERKEFIVKNSSERTKIQAEIQALNAKREAYISENNLKDSKKNTLDNIMLDAIKEQASEKNFIIEKN